MNEILLEAIESRASDVHIESQAAGIKIRYRIDGMLQPQPVPPEINRFQAAIISRLKIMARLNIAEKRLPQDGRIKLRMAGREIDVRVSVIPMLHGEGIVMRLLDKGRMKFSLEALGMEPDLHMQFSELIRMPHGIVLVTGPTGSGKTTTLYSSLLEIKRRGHQDHHDRRPGRIPARRHQPDSGPSEDRADVRHVAALDPASRPGHRAGRRNSRHGNGRERDPGLAHRPPGVQHAAHERRPQRVHAAGRHGRRAVPGGQHGRSRDGPAAGADALQRLPRAVRAEARRPAQGFSLGRFHKAAASRSIGRRAAAPAASSASSAGKAFSNCA